jgi:hypothetical protein
VARTTGDSAMVVVRFEIHDTQTPLGSFIKCGNCEVVNLSAHIFGNKQRALPVYM